MRICLYTNTALPKIGGQEFVVDALGRQFLALGHRAGGPRPLAAIARPVRPGLGPLSAWRGIRGSSRPDGASPGTAVGLRGCTAATASTWSTATAPIRPATSAARCKALDTCRWSSPVTATTWRCGPYDRKPAARSISAGLGACRRCRGHRRFHAGCIGPPVPGCGGSCRFPTASRSSTSPRPCRGRRASPPRSARNPICSSWAGSLRGKGSTSCWKRWPCFAAEPSSTWSWREAAGRPGPGSPRGAARSCPPGPFRRPDGGPADDVPLQTAFARSCLRGPGKPLHRGGGESCRRGP